MRKFLLPGLFLGMLLITFQHVRAQEKPKNILFIAVDDLKPLLQHYGYSQMHTPNFDRLASMGATFTNAHVQQAVCGPSRASIMTGTYPDRTRVWDLHTNFRESAPDLVSMPEYLISRGYQTYGIGKIYHKGSTSPGHDEKSWSIPYQDLKNFDPAYGTPVFNYYQDPETKAAFEEIFREAEKKGIKKGKLRGYAFDRLKPSTECVDVSDEAYQDGIYTVEAIRQMKAMKEAGKPFFLAVGYQKPHLPFIAPKKYWDLYDRDKIELAPFRELAEGTPKLAYHSFGELRSYSDIDNDLRVGQQLPVDKQMELIHGYMASVSFIDAQLGKLLDALESEGLSENTVIVLWGDHGYHLGDHTLWNKHSNFEQATRIPFMFAGPGIEKGTVTNHPVELVDAFPTLFDLCGIETPSQVEGQSLLPLMDGDDKTTFSRPFALSQFHRRNGEVMGYTIRTDKYRYTEWHENTYRSFKPYMADNIVGFELYDYINDPNETRNLVDEQAYDSVRKELKGMLYKRLTE